jgi:hypothetical protein
MCKLNGHTQSQRVFRRGGQSGPARGGLRAAVAACVKIAPARVRNLAGSIPNDSRGARVFRLVSVLLSLCLLAPPGGRVRPKGQKNYKQGLQYEAAQQWEKAAEEFSLAVAAEPSNSEYQLHYRRALFNASQAFMQQGGALMDRRRLPRRLQRLPPRLRYDPANELAAR